MAGRIAASMRFSWRSTGPAILARDMRSPGPGFDRAARLIETLAFGLAEALSAPDAIAAE